MGQTIKKSLSEFFSSWAQKKKAKILMVGLDSAGKTSILYKLKLDEEILCIPTIGFNVETLQYHKINFTMWDIGGQDKIRELWKYYYSGTDAIIFVIDSNDIDRIQEAKEQLHKMMSDSQLENSQLLILANKQDLPHAIDAKELSGRLGLNSLKQKNWFIQPCVAPSGEGLFEGLDWLSNQL
eukprot:gene10490-3011_t